MERLFKMKLMKDNLRASSNPSESSMKGLEKKRDLKIWMKTWWKDKTCQRWETRPSLSECRFVCMMLRAMFSSTAWTKMVSTCTTYKQRGKVSLSHMQISLRTSSHIATTTTTTEQWRHKMKKGGEKRYNSEKGERNLLLIMGVQVPRVTRRVKCLLLGSLR